MSISFEPFGKGAAKIICNPNKHAIEQLPIEEIKQQFKQSGALLFRGFSFSPMSMKSFADQFSSRFNRDRIRPSLAGSDGFVQHVTEGMGYAEAHAEQANSPFRPDAIWFCCTQPAAEDGETLIWDGVSLWNAFDDELRGLFSSKKLRYFQRYSVERWKLFLGAQSSIDDARRELDGRDGVTYHVTDNGDLYLEYVCSAVVKTKYGKDDAFVNGLLTERKNTLGDLMTFSDGTPVSDQIINKVYRAMTDITQVISWQPGDLIFIDNTRYLHGRNAFSDPNRKITSCMSFLNF